MKSWVKLKRTDKNQKEIVKAFRQAGASVVCLSNVGNVPDLLIGFMQKMALVEVKVKDGIISTSQKKFMAEWRGGPVFIARELSDVENILKAMFKWG